VETHITREAAWELLRKYNKDSFHLQHALTVEGGMRWYAGQLGFAAGCSREVIEQGAEKSITTKKYLIIMKYPCENCKLRAAYDKNPLTDKNF